jgi:hypothetical protein
VTHDLERNAHAIGRLPAEPHGTVGSDGQRHRDPGQDIARFGPRPQVAPTALQFAAKALRQADVARRLAHQGFIGPVGAAAIGDLEITPAPLHAVVG